MALKHNSNSSYQSEQFHDSLTRDRDGSGSHGDSGAGGRQAYLVEHLATFTVTRETGIVYPADGMRRLLQLEKTNGIWSQKMQLCLDGPWVLIMDYESGSIMERFSCQSIQEPTAFTSSDPMEMYNNILAFIVSGRAGARSEMHIFQCHDVGAQDLVEDLNLLRQGKPNDRRISQTSGSRHDARYEEEDPRDFVMERERDREKEMGDRIRRNQIPHFSQYREPVSDSDIQVVNEDEASSTSSDKLYEQDIAILNRCFDDIEKFIARLQHVAAASRELERRRRSRKSSKKQDPGDGMLSMRTRPPPEHEFYDIFQKFKLSFNLLAKLKSHIHDPNAPELVHFLFTPLALIVDASHESCPEPRLASRVIQPLLTRETINLLVNCVTSKETELWHSLGDAWLVPRDQWKTPVPPYQPVFMDGWSPDFYVVDEVPQRSQRRSDASSNYHLDDGREDYPDRYSPYARQPRLTEVPLRDSSSPAREPDTRDREDMGQAWAEDVIARGGRVVRVTYPRTANNDKELTVVRGEYLELLDDTRKWWKARNRRGQVAHVPHTIVAPHAQQDVFSNPLYSTNYPQDNARGGSASPRDSPSVSDIDSVFDIPISNSTPQPPPVPPPQPPPMPTPTTEVKTVPLKDEPSMSSASKYNSLSAKSVKSMAGDDMQEELKIILAMRENRKKLDIMKTPDLFIDQTSSSSEVQKWLEAKSFNEDLRKKLRGLNGAELFKLRKSELQMYGGEAEGWRLYSQLLVQRNVSGYKTTTSKELTAILQKVREKVEDSKIETDPKNAEETPEKESNNTK